MRITVGRLRAIISEELARGLLVTETKPPRIEDRLGLWLQKLMRNGWNDESAEAFAQAVGLHVKETNGRAPAMTSKLVRSRVLAPAYVASEAKQSGDMDEFNTMESRARAALATLLLGRK
mgnify:CR=1 FL=1